MKSGNLLGWLLVTVMVAGLSFSLSIRLVHHSSGNVVVFFEDNPNPASLYEANITVRNSSYEQTFSMSVEGYGNYTANISLSLPSGYYDYSISISNSTSTKTLNYSETDGLAIKTSPPMKLVFNISVSSDPSFDESYINGNSQGDGYVRYMYSGKGRVFALVFPPSHASLQRTPYSIMSVNSSVVYIGFGNISSKLDSFSMKPGISISPPILSGNYRVLLWRDDVTLESDYCSRGDRKIVLEHKGFKSSKPWIKVTCI